MYCLGIGAPVIFILVHICAHRRRLITGGNLHSMEKTQVGWGVGEGLKAPVCTWELSVVVENPFDILG